MSPIRANRRTSSVFLEDGKRNCKSILSFSALRWPCWLPAFQAALAPGLLAAVHAGQDLRFGFPQVAVLFVRQPQNLAENARVVGRKEQLPNVVQQPGGKRLFGGLEKSLRAARLQDVVIRVAKALLKLME
jgi:hypothetical protein